MFKKGSMKASPSPGMTEHITKKRKKGFGMKKVPHPKLGMKKNVIQDLGTPFLNY